MNWPTAGRLLLLALTLPLAAHAAQWVKTGSAGGSETFIDKASLRPNGETVQAWSVTSFANVQATPDGTSYRSVKALRSYACDARTTTLLSQAYYAAPMANGPVAQSFRYEKFAPEDVLPGSTHEDALRIACRAPRQKLGKSGK